jgi:hypothetical protein
MRIEYRSNENSTAANDFFIFKVLVGDKIYLEERFTITVYPESYWDGLQIGSNNTLLGKACNCVYSFNFTIMKSSCTL